MPVSISAIRKWVNTRVVYEWRDGVLVEVACEGYEYDGPWALAHDISPTWAAEDYQLFNDTGAAGSSAIAAQNTAGNVVNGTKFRLRVNFGETANATVSNVGAWALQFSINGGAFTTVGAATSVRFATSDAAEFVDGNTLTQALGGVTGSATYQSTWSEQAEDNTLTSRTWTDDDTEAEFCLELSGTSIGNTVTFRMLAPDSVATTFTNVPTVNVIAAPSVPPPHTSVMPPQQAPGSVIAGVASLFLAAAALIPQPADTIQRGAIVTQEQRYEPSTSSYGQLWYSDASIPNANSIGNAEYTSGTQQYVVYNEGRAVWFKVPNEIVAVAVPDEPVLRTLVSVADQAYDPAYAKTWFAHELIPDADEIAGSEIHTGSQHLDYAKEAYAKTFRVPVEILATVDGVPHTLTAAPQTLDAAYGKTFQYPPEPLVVVDQGVPKTLYAAQEPGDLQTRAYTWFADALIPDANSIGSAQFTSGAHAADYAAQSKGTVWSTPASLYGAEVVTDIYRATYVVQPQAINQAQGVVFHVPTELAAVVDGVPGTLFASELRADAGYAQLFDVPPEIAAVVGGIPGTIVQDEIRADSGYASVFEVPAEIAVVVPGIPHTLVQGEVRADAGYAKTFRYQPESVEFVVAPKTLYAAPEPADTQTRAYVWFADPEIPDADAIGAKRYTFGTHAADYAAQCRAEVWGTPAPLNVVAEAIYRTTFVQGEVRADAGYAGELFTVPTEILAVVPGIPHTLVTPEVRADNGYATTFDVPVEIAAVIPGIPGTLVQGEVRADSGYAALFDVPLGIAVSAEPPPPHTLYAYPQTQLIDPAYGKIFSYSWAISAFALPPKTLVAVPPVDTGSAQTFQYAWELHAVALPPKTLYAYPQTQLVDPAYGLVWHLGQLPGIDLPPPPTRIVWPQTHYVDPAYALLWQYPWESERFALPPKTLYAYPQNQFIDPAYFERTGGKPQPEPIPLGLKLPHKFIVVEMDDRYVTVELDPRESVVIQIKRYVDVGD